MWFKALELLGSLSILIVLHELGHFLAAKYFKVRVEKFYLFFDFMFPAPNVLNFALFKKKIGDTEYGIGWFPMGGYVQMSGIMDESMDKEALAQPVKDYEFRAKPAWQRMIILLGGIIVNVLLAFVIYSGMSFTWGDSYIPVENLTHGLYVDSLAESIGLQNGDHIIEVAGKKVTNYRDIKKDMILDLARDITVKRGDKTFKIDGLSDKFYGIMLNKKHYFIEMAFPTVIDSIFSNTAISKTNIKKGDEIISIDGNKIDYYVEFTQLIAKMDVKESKTLDIEYSRDGEIFKEKITIDSQKKFGFVVKTLKIEHRDYSFVQALVAGPVKTYETLDDYLKQFKLIFNREIGGYKQIGGFGAIGGMFPSKENFTWYTFWALTAFLSVMLAFLNLLPIPALDGGHAMFTLYEMIVGKPANEKFMEYAQMVGMALLFGLLIYANGNDLIKGLMNWFG